MPDHDSFVDGVTEEIITALSRVRWFFVIARGSAFAYKSRDIDPNEIARELGVRYILTGSVRRAGDRIRVCGASSSTATAAATSGHEATTAHSPIFFRCRMKSRRQSSAASSRSWVGQNGKERGSSNGTASMHGASTSAACFTFIGIRRDDLAQARNCSRTQSLSIRSLGRPIPPSPRPTITKWSTDLPNRPATTVERAIEFAQKAVALDRDDAGAHCTLGRIRYLCREYAAAISELELALDLNPSLALAHYGLGAAFVFSGRPHERIPTPGIGHSAQSPGSKHGFISRAHR